MKENNESGFSLHAAPYFLCPDIDVKRARKRARTEDVWLQEYCLGFIDEATAQFSYDNIRNCMYL